MSWYFATGFDKNSQTADPQFVDITGLDNRLGFDRGNRFDGRILIDDDADVIEIRIPIKAHPGQIGTQGQFDKGWEASVDDYFSDWDSLTVTCQRCELPVPSFLAEMNRTLLRQCRRR